MIQMVWGMGDMVGGYGWWRLLEGVGTRRLVGEQVSSRVNGL